MDSGIFTLLLRQNLWGGLHENLGGVVSGVGTF